MRGQFAFQVLLAGTRDFSDRLKPVEYGSIQIWLDAFPAREKAPIKWFAYKSAAHTVVNIYSLRRFVKNALNVREALLFMDSTTFSVDKTGTRSFQSLKSFP